MFFSDTGNFVVSSLEMSAEHPVVIQKIKAVEHQELQKALSAKC